LPNGDLAIVPDEKLLDYLNENHPEQPGHAQLFRSLLGIGPEQALVFKARLLEAAASAEATTGKPSNHGSKYEIRFEMTGPRGPRTILSVWIVEHLHDTASPHVPRLVTAYIE